MHEAKVNFPSSKTCSSCGYKMAEMPVSVRQWTCPQCGAEHDRDVNAAINLKQHAVSSTVSACGELGVVVPSVKQEVNVKVA
ncbi:MAG: transposase [Synergistaceae bacterium]|nr:transposase [Synergistaceae bacterium]